MFQIANICEKGKFRMKCWKYDESAKGASRNFLDMLIDHRNHLWNKNFLKFPWLPTNFQISLTSSKIPRLFPDLEFPWLFLTSGNPDKNVQRDLNL